MPLRFNPLPYENPEPTASQYAQQWGQSLNDLGDTFARNTRESRLADQLAMEQKLNQLKLEEEYSPEYLSQVFSRPSPDSPGMVKPLPGTDPNWRYSQPKRLKLLQEAEDRKRTLASSDVDMDYKRALTERALREPTAQMQKGEQPPAGFRWTPDRNLEAIPGGPAFLKTSEKGGAREIALNLYETAKQGLLDGLRATNTGPIMGRLPAFTSGQQIAEGGVAAMAPVLKQLFRVSGEGVFTDRDQQLLLDMIPTRKTNPDAFMTQIENIDRIVKAKLGMSGQGGRMSKQQRNRTTGETRTVYSDDGGQTWHP